MKDMKYRFFFGVFVGFILAGFFFFFFYRGTNAQPRPASPQPPATASAMYEPPLSYEANAGNLPPEYAAANYVSPIGVNPATVSYLNPGTEPAPNPTQVYVSQHNEPVAGYVTSPRYSYRSKPDGLYVKYLGGEPPPGYINQGSLYKEPSTIYPVYYS
jgi:hypothetical protein